MAGSNAGSCTHTDAPLKAVVCSLYAEHILAAHNKVTDYALWELVCNILANEKAGSNTGGSNAALHTPYLVMSMLWWRTDVSPTALAKTLLIYGCVGCVSQHNFVAVPLSLIACSAPVFFYLVARPVQ